MRTISNAVQICTIVVCMALFTIVTPVEGSEGYETELLTGQQCSIEKNGHLLLTHGRHHRHRHYHPYPSYPLPPLLHYPLPYYPYPHPISGGVCRNQLLFCYMNVHLPVGSSCVCYAPFGGVWFSGQVTAY